ncbi:mfs allantoate protein [Fusarium austroafricanum]|uniref:Mfs allantoate protein n=1 Tax=Fusarium austroafricanum TaxID=2364996 RepID=A0A8H4KJF6_9HYPO|nr:mfs allantoate protein [Fusarium austroafricanum]
MKKSSKNGVVSIEDGLLPSKARHLAKGLEAINKGRNPMKALRRAKDEDEDRIWGLPEAWTTGLQHTLPTIKALRFDKRMDLSDPMEMMERDRAFSFEESFHMGDLQPGCNAKPYQLQDILSVMLRTKMTTEGSTDWFWFIAEILDWLELRGDYDEYTQDPQYPRPHSFIVQDLVQAFAMMAMFFPNLDVTKLVTMFINSSQCDEFRKSGLFEPKERSQTRPGRRTRTSYKFREKGVWKEWKDFYKKDSKRLYGDVYPMEWSLTVRPIIAHLYSAGVIAPAYIEPHPQVILGIATASKEPHRPDTRDLFINYEDQYDNFPFNFPSSFVHPKTWPEVLPPARTFSSKHTNARFALLRLWSAPHYYPQMVGLFNRQNTSFLDSRGRSWEWKFVPMDMPGREYSVHHTTGKRLDILKHKFEGGYESG